MKAEVGKNIEVNYKLMLSNSCILQVRYIKDNNMFFHDKKRRTTFILVSLEGESSSDMRAGKSYTDLDLSLWLLLTYLPTYLLTYLLTPWNTVLLEKLTSFQLVKKFPAFYGTRKFITTFTSARHLSLSWAISIQSV
jgi:hypothetical protein